MMNQVAEKTVLVTGGGRGLGASISRRLALAGAIVIVADMQREFADKVVSGIVGSGGKAVAVKMDVGAESDVSEAVNGCVSRFGRLDAVINNAGTDKTVSVEELGVDDWDRVMATNLRGPFIMSKAVLPVMKRQGEGHIINVASTASKRAWANASAYHASKWGLLGFSHALHVEARPFNIKVTALVCGGMKTPFLTERFPDIDQTTLQDPDNVAAMIEFVLSAPKGTVIPEIMAIPMKETSWP